jgi:hypothetical protein
MLRAMREPRRTFHVLMLTSLSGLVACGGGGGSNAGSTTPTSTPTSTATPTGPKAPDHPESDKVTWKKGAKSCHTGAKATGDLTAVVNGMANACLDTKAMHQVNTPTTGQGDSTNASSMVKQIPLAAKGGHCYRAIGIAEATVSDFDIAIMDSAGKSAGEDATDSNDSVVLEDGVICFKVDDAANVNAAVANGSGKWAVAVWSD